MRVKLETAFASIVALTAWYGLALQLDKVMVDTSES
jgi:hypothetical protein